MKRKHLYYILSLLLLVAGCDIIDEKDRVIQTDELHFTNKIVLLEDFTGHKCVNCPVAADEIARLEEWCEWAPDRSKYPCRKLCQYIR